MYFDISFLDALAAGFWRKSGVDGMKRYLHDDYESRSVDPKIKTLPTKLNAAQSLLIHERPANNAVQFTPNHVSLPATIKVGGQRMRTLRPL